MLGNEGQKKSQRTFAKLLQCAVQSTTHSLRGDQTNNERTTLNKSVKHLSMRRQLDISKLNHNLKPKVSLLWQTLV